MVGNCICDDAVCCAASRMEILRRYYTACVERLRGKAGDEPVRKLELVMQQASVTPDICPAVSAALLKAETTGGPAGAMVLPDGRVVTGKTSDTLGAASALLLNALKAVGGIGDQFELISAQVLEPVCRLKTQYLGHKNPRLHTDEVLMALTISALTNPLAELAQQGFLEVRPRQGTFVADYRRKGNLSTLIAIMEYQGGVLGKDEIRSILEVRRALEHLAAQRAIRYASDEALARLGDIVARIAAAQNNAQAAEAAFAFQHELALAGGNSILPLIYYSFKAPVITLWLRFCRMYGIGALCRNTETLYNYLCRRDMDGAERWIDAYLEQAIDGSQQIYEER